MLNKEENNIRKGLRNVDDAKTDITKMQKKLEVEKKELQIVMDQTNKILEKLKVENKKAAEKEEEVNKIKADCEAEKAKIEVEKEEAEADLATAMPFLNAAIQAGKSIDVNKVKELRGAAKSAVDAIRIVMDAILIIFGTPLEAIKP